MPGSWHASTARPACDTVRARPVTAGPADGGNSSHAVALPYCCLRAALPAAGRPGRDGDREPARVTTMAGAQDEPILAVRTSAAYRRPASEAPGQPMLAGGTHQHLLATRTGRHAPGQHRHMALEDQGSARAGRRGRASPAGSPGRADAAGLRCGVARQAGVGACVRLQSAVGGSPRSRPRAEDIHRLFCHRRRRLTREGAPAWPGP